MIIDSLKCLRRMRDAVTLAVLGLCNATMPAQAMPPPNITANETALLPAYCRDTQTWPGGNPGAIDRGKAIYGEVFWHFHHYCYSMVWLMRAERSTLPAMERRGNLAGALDDLDYVLKYMPPDHFLLPEMLTRKGKVLRMQNRARDAIDVLREAIALNRSYWRAYSELALCHDFANDKQQAIAVLQEGLTHNPGAKVLTLHLNDLQRTTPAGRPGTATASKQPSVDRTRATTTPASQKPN